MLTLYYKSLAFRARPSSPSLQGTVLPEIEKNDIISMVEEETQQMVVASNEVQPPLEPPTKKAKQEKKV